MAELTELEPWEAELLGTLRQRGQQNARLMVGRVARCDRCRDLEPTRTWPLADRPLQLCDHCWLGRVRGEIVEQWDRHGVRVSTTHPQHGELCRGTIRPVGIVHRGLQPAVVWLVQDQDSTVVADEYVGDFVGAREALFAATGWADQLDDTETNETEG